MSRTVALWGAALVLSLALLPAAAAPLKTLAVLDLELIDDTYDKIDPETRRLALVSQRLREALSARGLYQVVDTGPAAALIGEMRQSQELHHCNGCAQEIGRRLGADRVLVGSIFKLSRLVLNLDLRIIDVGSNNVVLVKSVDLRGNTDESWLHAVNYVVRDMEEKGQGNR